jgi:hypothetical protein
MIIGGDFNGKCEQLLLKAGKLAGDEPGTPVSVVEINAELEFERKEIRSYLEYLSDRGFIQLTSIGGPLLYGHLALTRKGLSKIEELRSKT